MIFSLRLGVGHSVLLQLEGVGHVFSNHHISKCSGPPPPPPVLIDQSLNANFALVKSLVRFGLKWFVKEETSLAVYEATVSNDRENFNLQIQRTIFTNRD